MCPRANQGVVHGTWLTAFGMAILLAARVEVSAKPPIRAAFFDAYPEAVGTRLDDLPSNGGHCGVCHFDFNGGGPRNPYGLAVEATSQDVEGILSIDGEDSDGDGFANGIEILDPDGQYSNTPTFPGLTAGNVGQVSNVLIAEIEDYLSPITGPDIEPPIVTVQYPNGSEILTSSSAQTILWSATDNSGTVTAVNALVTFDGGLSYDPLALGVPNSGSLTWFVHNRPTAEGSILIEAYDPSGNQGGDSSDTFFGIVSAPGGRVGTTLRDFDMPGTQPLGGGVISDPIACLACHGEYEPAVEPYFNWQGSMMSQASIDPLFLAAMEVANADAPESGDLCLRCHIATGWLAGRSVPTDGSQMQAGDLSGVSCDQCHRMVDPVYEAGVNPVEDVDILAELEAIPSEFTLAQYVIDPTGTKRGPVPDPVAPHSFLVSPFHRESAFCGTCHDVGNPVFTRNPDGTYSVNPLDAPSDGFGPGEIGPVERTYSEWLASAFPVGVYAPEFGGNKEIVSSCQDCHLRDVSGAGCGLPGAPIRDDLPLHDMTGGSTWLPTILDQVNPSANPEALQAGAERARYMLQYAAELSLSQSGATLFVTVTNKCGHKLPTGYPEGRRIWINVRFYDGQNNVVSESGAYDAPTGELFDDPDLKVYEAEPVVSEDLAPLVGLPDNAPFHFVLNDKILKDNRIPPAGFTNAAYEAFGGAPVGATYEDGQNYDVTEYAIPAGCARAEVTLYYQSTTKEYVEFLRDNGTPGGAGQTFYDLWDANAKCPPEPMVTADAAILPGIVHVASSNAHVGIGPVAVAVDAGASVDVDSGAVTTESRVAGVTRLEITFADALDPSVGALGDAAVTITPDPGGAVATLLTNGDQTLVLEFTPALPDQETYVVALTDSVIAAGVATPGDRDFEIRALAGNVASESGAGPQVVNAIDIGLTGIRGKFGADVANPLNAPFDVNQDGAINALDMSCVRLVCGVFGNTAP